MALDTALIAAILLMELARWAYDWWWQCKEDRELAEQTRLLEDIAVTLELREVGNSETVLRDM